VVHVKRIGEEWNGDQPPPIAPHPRAHILGHLPQHNRHELFLRSFRLVPNKRTKTKKEREGSESESGGTVGGGVPVARREAPSVRAPMAYSSLATKVT
jgi:hypothetical protein